MTDPIVVGIDIAATRPCVAVAVSVGRGLRVRSEGDWLATGDRRELVAWLERLAPAAVAIDAPQGYNRHLLLRAAPGRPVSRSRVCDHELLRRRVGVYQVPARDEVRAGEATLLAWMNVGFGLWGALKRQGFEVARGDGLPGAFGQAPELLEAYPYAAFVALQGYLLPKKMTREGQVLRVRILRRQGIEWADFYDHDSLDALAAALTAARFLQGRACAVGNEREGLIWLPVARADLREKYTSETADVALRAAGA